MKKVLFTSILVIALISALLISGCSSDEKSEENSEKPKVSYSTVWVFRPAGDAIAQEDEIEKVKNVIETRLDYRGITEHLVYYDEALNTFNLQFNKPDDIADEMEISVYLSSQGKLTFRSGNEYETSVINSDGKLFYKTPVGDSKVVLMDGSMVKGAEAKVDLNNGTDTNVVELTFTDEGTKKFEDITTENLNKVISLWIDDIMISAPTVNSVISDGKAIVSGDFTAEDAMDLANQIKAGTLPFALERVQ